MFVICSRHIGISILRTKLEVKIFRQFRQWFFFGPKNPRTVKRIQQVSTLPVKLILGKENREKCITRLQEMKPFRLRPTSVPERKAAVLVPLCMVKHELSLLYTLRSSDLKNYRGQVSFPGGMYDKEDADLQETATRETYEELGIPPQQIDIWGQGSPIGTVSREMSVLPVLAYIGEVNLQKLQLNRREVEAVFSIPLATLCDPSNFKYTQFRNSYTLPVFIGGEYRVWGMTAIITHIILGALIPNAYKNKLKYIRSVLSEKKTEIKTGR